MLPNRGFEHGITPGEGGYRSAMLVVQVDGETDGDRAEEPGSSHRGPGATPTAESGEVADATPPTAEGAEAPGRPGVDG